MVIVLSIKLQLFEFSNGLTHYQTTDFRLFQTERVCRRQLQIWRKWQKVIQTGRKHCGKRRNCSLRAISPFPQCFQKDCFQKDCFPEASKGVIVWEWVNLGWPQKALKCLALQACSTAVSNTIKPCQRTNFSLVQVETIFRRHFQCGSNGAIFLS